MHIELFDPQIGKSLGITQQLDFKDIIQNQHCTKPIVLRFVPDTEVSISNLKLFLEDKGVDKNSNFFFYTHSVFIPGIESGSNVFSPFSEVPNVASYSTSGGYIVDPQTIPNGSSSDFVWLDVQSLNQIGVNLPNFRLFFDTP
jgi:hypothetical protein